MARFMRFAYATTLSVAILLLLDLGTYSLHPWARGRPRAMATRCSLTLTLTRTSLVCMMSRPVCTEGD